MPKNTTQQQTAGSLRSPAPQTPKLRFPGFSGVWEEKRLGEIFSNKIKRNKDGSGVDVLTNSATQGIVNQRDYFDKDIAVQGNLENYYIVDVDDFVYNPRISNSAPVGPLKRNKLKKGVMSPLYTVLKPKEGNYIFLEKYFETTRWYRYMYKIANYGARHDRMAILQDDFMKMPVPFPPLPEQEKIASFLGSVDQWVEHLKSEYETLQTYKKGIMQKIFSQQIRFKDDQGNDFLEWEEKRLGEVGEIKTSSVDKKIDLNEKKVLLLNYMDVYKRNHIFVTDNFQEITAKENQISSCNLKKGDVLFTPSSETPIDIGHSAVVMEDLPNVLFSYHLMRFRPKKGILDHLFSGYAFKSFGFYKKLWRLAQGATRFTLSLESMKDVKVFIPKSLEEQQKIAEFLSSVDTLLESKQQQITSSEEWKKGLMQGLFV